MVHCVCCIERFAGSVKRKEDVVARRYGYSGKYSVSLYPVDHAVVTEVQETQNFGTFSGALQWMIRRFAEEHGIEVRARVTQEEPAAAS